MAYRPATDLPADIKAGITVSLVAIPLCLGIALASDAPAISGIISGIIGGVIIGPMSGSRLSVSGPANSLIAVILSAVAVMGSFNMFLLSLVIAGIFQIILGLFRAGSFARYIPYSVIKGMLAAIGIIIILKQIPHAMGFDNVYEGSMEFFQKDGTNTISELLVLLNHFSPGAIIVTLVSFACLYIFSLPALKEYKFFRLIPGALAAIIISALINQAFQAFVPSLALYDSHLVNIPSVSLTNLEGIIMVPDFSALMNPLVYKYALIIAVIASIETLLSIEAIDKLDPQKRVTPTNRELKSQGVGNILAGLIGGLPITSVIMRSTVNLENDARSKLSTIVHGLCLILALVIGAELISSVPLASLAAILIVTGYKLTSEKIIREMFKRGWNKFLPFITTLVAVFFSNLLIGVLCGLLVSMIFILRQYHRTHQFQVVVDEKHHRYTFTFPVYLPFLSKASLHKSLSTIPAGSEVIIDLRQTTVIDDEVKEMLKDYITYARSIDTQVYIYQPGKIELAEYDFSSHDTKEPSRV